MPKQKTKTGAKKRFRLTGSGKIKRAKMNRRHILTKMNSKRMRSLRKVAYVDSTQEKTIKNLI